MPQREVIATDNAPAAIGPYSQGIRAGHFLFTAGQLGISPATGKLVSEDAAAQADQALRNLSAILEAAGGSLSQVVKTTVFLADISEYPAVNAVYARFFREEPPARSVAQAAALPLGAQVEIEVIALIDRSNGLTFEP